MIRDVLFPGYVTADRDVLFRALGMDRFGMYVDGVRFREAGDFWFRSVWFRDLFEGYIHNYQTLRKIEGMSGMKEALLKSFDLQDDYGRIPNRLVPGTGQHRDYNSADATLLAFIVAGMVVRDGDDGDLAKAAAEAFRRYLKGIRCCEMEENGPPRLRPNGMISVPAWHSWTDGMREVDGRQLPIRVTEAWERELIERNAVEDLFRQKFFLPEIIAQWMRALEAGWRFCRYDRDFATADICKTIYNRVRESYKPVFLNPATGFINNLAGTDDFALGRQTDATPGSPGVVAAAMLGLDVFSLRELEGIASLAKSRLLRTKWGMPFGIIVRESEREVYLGDPEYHEAVVWPRDTPYLIRLLQLTGDQATVDGLLKSNLRHQMEESFIFYNQELFSGDDDRTPVKDPVQWWSQWVDPYLDRRAH
jgi:glycogen debranching enzyme